MAKTAKMLKIDSLLPAQKLSRNEMKAMDGGFSCYCNGTYKGEMGSIASCWNAC
ncbi:hypothetical protein [Labilibaculum manganireducens]|uniref:hypothetical protein n=1 Tax=Labilibaculum manganireducens TaxID=1940525 RepID=UPI0015D58BFB|nr:hypothetical protein [Labilibaculum manganireducens]